MNNWRNDQNVHIDGQFGLAGLLLEDMRKQQLHGYNFVWNIRLTISSKMLGLLENWHGFGITVGGYLRYTGLAAKEK